jgi:adenosylmethionine-8-amino-7-oxononanoate aminotransferase
MNGFTYFANPLSCAIGHAVLQEMVDRDLVANAAQRGAQLQARLWEMATSNRVIGDVRGRGLLLAVEVVADQETKKQLPLDVQAPSLFQKIALDMGLATYCRRTSGGAYGDWLMITPPLIVTQAQVDEIATGLEQALREFERTITKMGH